MRSKTTVGMAIMVCALLIGASVYWVFAIESKPKLRIFRAGSLNLPFDELERMFEANSEVDVQMVSGGSVKLVRSLTDLNKECDVIAVADYSLIQELIPKHASWYIKFATNRIVLAYTNKSRYSDAITNTNWYEILAREGVKFGFSNPNDDPCGYRALIVVQLAEIYYNNTRIFDYLIVKNTKVTASEDNGNFTIKCQEDIAPNTNKIVVRSKSVELVHLLKSHDIDYAFEYSSVVAQHGLRFLELPAQINLGDLEQENLYRKVEVKRFPNKCSIGKAVVYGLTISTNSQNEKLAIDFVKFLIEKYREGVMDKYGQPGILPPQVNDKNLLPTRLQPLVVEE